MINKTCVIGLNRKGAMKWRYSANHIPVSSSTFVNYIKKNNYFPKAPYEYLIIFTLLVFYRIFDFYSLSLSVSSPPPVSLLRLYRVSQYRRPISKRELWLAGSDPGPSLGEGEHCSIWWGPE